METGGVITEVIAGDIRGSKPDWNAAPFRQNRRYCIAYPNILLLGNANLMAQNPTTPATGAN